MKSYAVFFIAGACLATTVCGQPYPNKPIRIVTAAAGGATDFVARQIAQGISGPLGQQIVIDNRPAVIQGEIVSKAPPDGYVLYLAGESLWVQSLLQKVPYDVVRDFTPITWALRAPSIMSIHPSLPVKSVKELVALAKSRPGELNYNSGGNGASAHLAMELFKSLSGTNIVHIPYKGVPPGMVDLAAGQVQMTFSSYTAAAPYLKSGRLRAIAVSSPEPSPLYPDLPPVSATVPGYEALSMMSLLGPAKLPEAIVNRLNQEAVRYLGLPESKERFRTSGLETVGNSPEQFAAAMKADIARWSKVIRDANIKAD